MERIAELAARLARICGPGKVISDPLELRTYECDGLTAHRCSPALAVLPGTAAEVAAVVTACAATSALRASAQIYRGRYHGPGLETQRFLPIVEQAFAVLLDSSAMQPHVTARLRYSRSILKMSH